MAAIQFDAAKLKLFKQAYADAERAGLQVFVFEGHEFVLLYAKYLIEYLEKYMR